MSRTRTGLPGVVPARPAVDHARRLVHAGMPPNEIAATARVHPTTVTNLLAGRCERLYRTVAQLILAVPVPPPDYVPVLDGLIDATATRRRLQALAVLGWPIKTLGPRLGVNPATVSVLRMGARRLAFVSVHARVARLFDEVRDTGPGEGEVPAGNAERCRRYAAGRGWLPPEAWDGADIADPKARPKRARVGRPELVAVEAAFFAGLDRRQLAARLGMSRHTVDKNLSRAAARSRSGLGAAS